MASVRVNMRLPEDLWLRAEVYAKQRGSNRTAVVQAALESLLEDVKGGVPELPPGLSVEAVRKEAAPRPPVPPIAGVKRGSEVEPPKQAYELPKIAKRRW